jgi:hypothetical protein
LCLGLRYRLRRDLGTGMVMVVMMRVMMVVVVSRSQLTLSI